MAHESRNHQQALDYTNFNSTSHSVMQGFQPSRDLYSLQAGVEMLAMPSKPPQNSGAWRGFFPAAGGSSGAAAVSCFQNENLMVTPAAMGPWPPPIRMLVEESSARFLFDGNGRSSSGLSLSLNHAETSNSVYDQPPFDQVFQKPADYVQEGRFFRSSISPAATADSPYQQSQYLLKSSKYLHSARDLLNEFCNLEAAGNGASKHKANKSMQLEEGWPSSSSASLNQSLYSLDIHELQGRKTKLLAMLEEVDRRYRKYWEKMRAVVVSFEATAGEGAAMAFLTLASKVMSRHFRCLRYGIVGQIQAMRKAMGEKDAVAPGTTKGETPRLKLIDQCFRHQWAFQQAGMVAESHPWRPQRGLPEHSISILRAWLFEHFLHPYPSDVDKHILAQQTGLSRSQVSNWFINARVRLWKPMVEEMYLEETKDHEINQASQNNNNNSSAIYNSSHVEIEEQKPAPGQLLAVAPASLSWVINNSTGRERIGSKSCSQKPSASENSFGIIDMDHFASYDQQCRSNIGSGVSLTLGLQQHNNGGGMRLSFSPPAQQSTLLFSREQMEECHPSQFSILDGEAAQNVPYRNLMEAQLLRDLTG